MEVKTKSMYMYDIMWALQYIHDNLSKWHRDCWALHTKWYPSVRFELGNRLNGGQCQNKIGGAHLHHVGIAMYA